MNRAFDEAWFAARAHEGIRGLKAYDPGHDVVALRATAEWLVELGSNENPYGPSPDAREALLDSLHLVHRYPDPRGTALKAKLAGVHGVDPACLLLGNGSHELLMQLAQVFAGPGDDVVYSQFGFAVFAIATQAAGAKARVATALPRDAAMPLGHDLAALAAAVTPATKLVYVANPNNPTGTWFGAPALAAFVAAIPPEVIVVIDEAYAEMVDASEFATAMGLLGSHPNLVVTRTFSKAYGLAGLRCGYAVAHPALLAVLERVRESFNVNGFALAACAAALDDHAHVAWVRRRNVEQRAALARWLAGRGIATIPSQTNFLLAEFGERTPAIEDALLAHGIVLRPMRGYGLAHFSRITVGTLDEQRRLFAALDEVLA